MARRCEHAEGLELLAQLLPGGALAVRDPIGEVAVREPQAERVDHLRVGQAPPLEELGRLRCFEQGAVVEGGHLT